MTTPDEITPAVTVLDILARQAAEHREHARQRGIAAQDAKPLLKEAATILTARREHIEELEAQLAEIKAALADARAGHQEATARHAEALAAHAQHEAEAQQAADIAESLDRIAAQMRGRVDVPPAEALAATGLMPREEDEEPCDCPPGQCLADPFPDDDPPAAELVPVVAPTPPHDPDQPGTVVAVSGPLTTMPDVGLNPRPVLDPPPGAGVHSHAKPSDGLMARVTGGWPIVGGRRKNDEQPHEQDGDDRG